MEDSVKLAVQLKEMGFSEEETDYFVKLSAAGNCSCPERLRMLCDKRKETLNEIHRLEGQIVDMDFMKHEIKEETRRD